MEGQNIVDDNAEQAEVVCENDVKIEIPRSKKHGELMKYHNPKLAVLREAVLQSLIIESSDCDTPLVCLDASTGSGVAGLQWKKKCDKTVHVVTACTETDRVKTNCKLSGVKCAEWYLDPSHVTGQLPEINESKDEILVSPFHPNVVLRQEAFNFMLIHSNTSVALYTDSVFSNIRQNGVVCFLCPNIASQCFRSPNLILRQFGSHVQKTEYVKELAVRVVIADMARAAARYQKGIEVLYTMCLEDHFLIVIRAIKNHQQAVESMEKCRKILHCLFCEERVMYPSMSSPIEDPYSLIPCDCKKSNPGKTAVILGPMWTGNLYNVKYLHRLLKKVNDNNPKNKLCTLIQTMSTEAECRCESILSNVSCVNKNGKCKFCEQTSHSKNGEPLEKRPKLDNDLKANEEPNDNYVTERCLCKEKCMKQKDSDEVLTNTEVIQDMPLFYYDLQKKKYSGFPKLDRVITILRASGYRASRTHFEHQAIRTNANLQQLHKVLVKVIKK
ncbi:TRMT1-like protein [Mactra antiquata]